jgi:hypothetical protein
VAGATGLEPATSGVTGHIQTARGKGRGGECATATINHEVKLLSATYHLMQKEGVRVPAVIEFPQVKVPGKLRWFTEDEVAKLLAELDPNKVFIGAKGRMRGVKLTLNPVVKQQRQDAYDLAITLLDTGARLNNPVDVDGPHGVALDRPLPVEDRQLVYADDDRPAARGHAAALRGAWALGLCVPRLHRRRRGHAAREEHARDP